MFDDLLRSIADAVMSAHKYLGAQHYDVGHLFRPSRSHQDAFEPLTVPMVLPRSVVPDGENPEGIHHIPLATLVPHQATMIDTVNFSVPCLIDGLDQGDESGTKRLSLVLGQSLPNQHSRLGTLTITFKNGEPPEGMARINDQLLKGF